MFVFELWKPWPAHRVSCSSSSKTKTMIFIITQRDALFRRLRYGISSLHDVQHWSSPFSNSPPMPTAFFVHLLWFRRIYYYLLLLFMYCHCPWVVFAHHYCVIIVVFPILFVNLTISIKWLLFGGGIWIVGIFGTWYTKMNMKNGQRMIIKHADESMRTETEKQRFHIPCVCLFFNKFHFYIIHSFIHFYHPILAGEVRCFAKQKIQLQS